VFDLCQEHGHAHIKSIAEKLNNRMPTVTEAMKARAAKDLILHDVRRNISLTAKGLAVAEKLDRRHAVLAGYYRKVLGCSQSKAEDIACKVEHVVDDAFCQRLARFAEFLEQSPCGKNLISDFKKLYEKKK
jgi:DtxR family Mn-dependent transcriptional regulator